MTRRGRITAFGGAGVLIVAGVASAIGFGGLLGGVLSLVLIGTGLVLATSLLFLEVGLSDDRERERERERARSRSRERLRAEREDRRQRPRLTRMRSHRRGID
jgi:hypothetical protein